MKKLNIEGVRPGRRCITTIPSEAMHKLLDLVNCELSTLQPIQLSVADIACVVTWFGFVIDVFSRYIVGWRVLKHIQKDSILDVLDLAPSARGKPKGASRHSDRGSQYLSIRYTDLLIEPGFYASVGGRRFLR
jgi:putative transposase